MDYYLALHLSEVADGAPEANQLSKFHLKVR
jgi:hypothetical protein